MSSNTFIGIALLVGGAIALYFGLTATDSLSERVVEGVTGRYTDGTMWYLIGGGVAAVGGLALLFMGKR
ncbi:DUF3185 family protein [Pseudofulvimonas gallinarii]|uniref:Uncharacterized protein DUF3185 n=1 Tax=Pseudofulvimonas gallinarii TaxID=634155 RepID=A0A4R3LN01_9GAMM|nr:DUF3185 family protein [Pseudofulvimonas gallinarii]TCT00849.1 uncharacterized protein DUF3185 [Pseudofulvimonas gallinarii]THD12876.1 hypothetical protein B1808_11295 [Pseudofulvimonas gallinarii]